MNDFPEDAIVDIKPISFEKRQKQKILDTLFLHGASFAGLTSIVNLALFVVEKTSQTLPISIGAILCAGVSMLARLLMRQGRISLATFLVSLAWGGFFVIHGLFWAGFLVELLFGIWILPVLLALYLTTTFQRLITFVPSLAASIALVYIENSPLFSRIQPTDISFLRIAMPIYVAIFGSLFLLIILRGFQTKKLFVRMMSAMIVLVFIPIAILSIVSYYNTQLKDNRAATTSLEQIAAMKSNALLTWSAEQTDILSSLLTKSGSLSHIIGLLTATQPDPYLAEFTNELIVALAQSDFEEIILTNANGSVVASTHSDLVGTDLSNMDYFQRGKLSISVVPPDYYHPKNEMSVFISRPVQNYSGNVIGVLIGRAKIDPLLAIISQPISDKFQTAEQYLINSSGALLESSTERPNQYLRTDGANTLLSTLANGSGSYSNAKNVPVMGAYRWVHDLGVGIIIEVTQAEVYSQLPSIVATNIGIGAVAFLLAILAAGIIVRSITQPIDLLIKTSQEVIAGNLDARAEVEREDEIGTLTNAFNEMTNKLKSLVGNLEIRVAERTHDLEQRSLQLQSAAQIARDASLASNVDDLLVRTARLIRERFGFYHVGIFINDDRGEYTILRAAGGDAGQVMLANKFKLPVGEVGIVGYVSQSGEPRIALDVGADAVHFRNPLLPYTRSEMALPLKVGGRILGVLDVQSDKVNAFDQNDITIMEILTGQLSVAIERTRLFQESSENALALERAFRGQTLHVWQDYLERSRKPKGYRYEGTNIQPIELLDTKDEKNLPDNKLVILPGEPGSRECTAIVPIRLRSQILGRLTMKFSTPEISPETTRLLEEAANRLSLALENARLVQDAQRLASQEQQINAISAQIQQSTDLETILKNTVQELGKTLGVPKAFIQVGLVSSDDTN